MMDTPLEHGHVHGPGCGHHPVATSPDPAALVSARSVGLTRHGRRLLTGVDLDINPAEIVTLIGPNGAGKTTLVRTLLGLEPDHTGTIHRRPGLVVGYVPQRVEVGRAMPLTVARFLQLGTSAPPGEIDTALDTVGARNLLGAEVSRLSGGELQRVMLARALLRKPDLLVLDEPVQGVDQAGEAELYALIARVRDTRRAGILLVSHDLHVVMARADRVVCLNGHICCEGRPAAIAQHPDVLRLFGTDAARSFAVYTHTHDHAHGLSAKPRPTPHET